MKITLPRSFYVPAGAMKIADKQSSAVVYLYATAKTGKPALVAFSGKRVKPDANYSFQDGTRREKWVRSFFESHRAAAGRKADRAAERKAWVHDYKVGEILNTCWGYDQTNREFFEITEVNGKMLTLREVTQVRRGTCIDQGVCVPQPGSYKGKPIRRLAQQHSIKIDSVRYASRWGREVAGVVVGPALHYSEGH